VVAEALVPLTGRAEPKGRGARRMKTGALRASCDPKLA